MHQVYPMQRQIVLAWYADHPIWEILQSEIDELWRRIPAVKDVACTKDGKAICCLLHLPEIVGLDLHPIFICSTGGARERQMEVADGDGYGRG